jgi:hypothetical protein
MIKSLLVVDNCSMTCYPFNRPKFDLNGVGFSCIGRDFFLSPVSLVPFSNGPSFFSIMPKLLMQFAKVVNWFVSGLMPPRCSRREVSFEEIGHDSRAIILDDLLIYGSVDFDGLFNDIGGNLLRLFDELMHFGERHDIVNIFLFLVRVVMFLFDLIYFVYCQRLFVCLNRLVMTDDRYVLSDVGIVFDEGFSSDWLGWISSSDDEKCDRLMDTELFQIDGSKMQASLLCVTLQRHVKGVLDCFRASVKNAAVVFTIASGGVGSFSNSRISSGDFFSNCKKVFAASSLFVIEPRVSFMDVIGWCKGVDNSSLVVDGCIMIVLVGGGGEEAQHHRRRRIVVERTQQDMSWHVRIVDNDVVVVDGGTPVIARICLVNGSICIWANGKYCARGEERLVQFVDDRIIIDGVVGRVNFVVSYWGNNNDELERRRDRVWFLDNLTFFSCRGGYDTVMSSRLTLFDNVLKYI